MTLTRRALGALTLATLTTLALSGCGVGRDASYRFKMTVEVETPQGVKSGSGVMEVTAHKQVQYTSETRPLVTGLKGEAVVVETPSGPIFVLLKMPEGDGLDTLHAAATYALTPDLSPGGWEMFWKAMGRISRSWSTLRGEVPRANWPMMVRFGDINDPKSVQAVDPQAAGVKRIIIETTSDEVTTGIEKRIPSYGAASGFDSWYATLAMDDARRLTLDDFRKGESK